MNHSLASLKWACAIASLAIASSASAQRDWFDEGFSYPRSQVAPSDDVVIRGSDANFAPIHIASARGDVDVVLAELAAGVPVGLAIEGDPSSNIWAGLAPILIAAQFGEPEVVRVLLEHGADIEGRRQPGEPTPLLASAWAKVTLRSDHTATMRVLLENNADLRATLLDRSTALHLAAGRDHQHHVPESIIPEAHRTSHLYPRIRPHVGGSFGFGLSTPLEIQQAQNSDSERLQLLIGLGLDVNAITDGGYTVLGLAIRSANIERVQALLTAGADVNIKPNDDWNRSPVRIAASSGTAETLKLLIEEGADLNLANPSDSDPAILVAAAWSRLETGEKVALLLEAGAEIRSTRDSEVSAISQTVFGGEGDAVRHLLEAGADPLTQAARNDNLFLSACHWGAASSVRALYQTGLLDIELRSIGPGAPTPLMLAAKSEHESEQKVGFLLEAGANIEATSANGATPLIWAARVNNTGAIARLVEAGANLDVQDGAPIVLPDGTWGEFGHEGMTPLMYVAYRGGASSTISHATGEASTRLLLARGADVNVATLAGETALAFAIQAQHPEVVRLLLDAGADPNAIAGGKINIGGFWEEGATTIGLAIEFGEVEVFQWLIDAGADVNTLTPDVKQTALHIASSHSQPRLVRQLINAGASVDPIDVYGETPLMRAVSELGWEHTYEDTHLVECVRILLGAGADPNIADTDGTTPLMRAVGRFEGDAPIMTRLLLEAGADINAVDSEGNTALAYVSQATGLPMIHFLIDQGADPFTRNNRGNTVLGYLRASIIRRWRPDQIQAVKDLYDELKAIEDGK